MTIKCEWFLVLSVFKQNDISKDSCFEVSFQKAIFSFDDTKPLSNYILIHLILVSAFDPKFDHETHKFYKFKHLRFLGYSLTNALATDISRKIM